MVYFVVKHWKMFVLAVMHLVVLQHTLREIFLTTIVLNYPFTGCLNHKLVCLWQLASSSAVGVAYSTVGQIFDLSNMIPVYV